MEETAVMIEIPQLAAVLATEAIVALLCALVLLWYLGARKTRAERGEAAALVERINSEDEAHEQRLAQALSDGGNLAPSLRDSVLTEVLNKEKALYRQAIQAFLSRDPAKLAEIDRHVQGISEPYCRLIAELLRQAPRPESNAGLEAALEHAQVENAELQHRLGKTLQALEDVSQEYARMFGNPHTAQELSASLDRVLAAFGRITEPGATTTGTDGPPEPSA
ncbi:hypothetical protein SAMN02949497_4338 [Methylomagnum ishizawai]|uniref:Uncharacterized protein n=2 Tax=Methylomagnum ishizawai TaxID=1760988 RepID=A0A1Y6D9P5_9GAMM|nr:hypothetical protein SAMN02949497_4338 [Methylomagnum ishizawai]